MNEVDTLIIIAIIIGAGIGFIMGLFRAVVSLLSIILAAMAASSFYLKFSKIIERFIHEVVAAKIISFTIIFGGIFTILMIVGFLAYRLITILNLGMVDMISGALVGVIGALLIVSLAAILLSKFPFGNSQELFKQSLLTPYCLKLLELIIRLLPEKFKRSVL